MVGAVSGLGRVVVAFRRVHFLRVERRWPLGKKPIAANESHAAPLAVSPTAIGIGLTRAQN